MHKRGKAISEDLKTNIFQDIVEQGGDLTTGYFFGSVRNVALKHRVKTDTVREVWKCFCRMGETSIPRPVVYYLFFNKDQSSHRSVPFPPLHSIVNSYLNEESIVYFAQIRYSISRKNSAVQRYSISRNLRLL